VSEPEETTAVESCPLNMTGGRQAVRMGTRAQDATWFRVLDRFGLPTLFATALLVNVLRSASADREERRELLTGIRDAINRQTVVLGAIVRGQDEAAAALRLTWPKLRIPRVLPAPPATAAPGPGREP